MSGEPKYSRRWSVMTGAVPTFDGTSPRWDFIDDTVVMDEALLQSEGARGTRATVVAQTRRGLQSVGGTLTANPSPAFLGDFLVRAMGGGTATAPAFADLLPEWGMLADRGTGGHGIGDCFKYLGLKTNNLTLTGRGSGLIDCAMDVLGKTETAGQTFVGAALGTTLAYEPYTSADMALALSGFSASTLLLNWQLRLSNGLTARPASGSNTADSILEGERMVRLTGAIALYTDLWTEINAVAKNGVGATLTLSNSTCSTLFTLAAVQLPRKSLRTEGPEIIVPIMAEIRGTSAAEFTVTNDITP